MSIYTEIQVMCDVCEESFLEQLDDSIDIDLEVERNGGACGISISDYDYEHMCENCYNEVNYCEICDESKWNDDIWTCEDWVMCDDCVEDKHMEMLADGECEVIEGVCDLCDWEWPQVAKDQTREALVTL